MSVKTNRPWRTELGIRTGWPERAFTTSSQRVKESETTQNWGWLPALSLVCAFGLLLVSVAFTASRNAKPWAEPLFWLGLVVLYGPVAFRMAHANVTRREAIGMVALLGMGLYLVKTLHSPVNYTFNDEFLHWRTASDILKTGHLFTKNPILPMSALYPGLEIVANAIASTSGLTFFGTGIVLIGVARLMFVLALYLTYEKISGSTRVAGLGAVIYMANPNFVFFLADFSYESLSIPLLGLTILAIIRCFDKPAANRMGLFAVGLIGLAAIVTTHHVTSFAFTAFLLLWSGVHFIQTRGKRFKLSPTLFALVALGGCVSWVLSVATLTLSYLGPHLTAAVTEISHLIINDEKSTASAKAGRQLFQSASGELAPLWERIVGLSSVGLVVICLPLGAYLIWRHRRKNSVTIAIAISALMYPVSLCFRFTASGWEAANRCSEFLYLGTSFLIAVVIAEFELPIFMKRWGPVNRRVGPALIRWAVRLRAPLFGACAVVVLLGGVIAGWPPLSRLPGTYMVDAGIRSIDPKGIGAALWSRNYLGPNNHIGTDNIQILLQGTYGEQWVSSTSSGGVNALWILYTPQLHSDHMELLQKGRLQYLVVDRRLGIKPNLAKSYYPEAITAQSLAKFDRIPGVSRIFDDGDIVIYDVGALSGVR